MTLQHNLTREIAAYDPYIAEGLELVLLMDKKLHPEWNASLRTRSEWPHVGDIGGLSSNHFTAGHFTEVVSALGCFFGPCVESAEVCFWYFGYYVGRPLLTREDLNAVVMRQLRTYFARTGSSSGSKADSIRSRWGSYWGGSRRN